MTPRPETPLRESKPAERPTAPDFTNAQPWDLSSIPWLDYPPELCIYCGETATERDHIVPTALTGLALRPYTPTVPACGDCNASINDLPSPCITDRRERAHASIRRRRRAALQTRDWQPAELAMFEGRLRAHVETAMRRKAAITARLAWPPDPAYDLRVFERSGVEDPYALGLLRRP